LYDKEDKKEEEEEEEKKKEEEAEEKEDKSEDEVIQQPVPTKILIRKRGKGKKNAIELEEEVI